MVTPVHMYRSIDDLTYPFIVDVVVLHFVVRLVTRYDFEAVVVNVPERILSIHIKFIVLTD